MGVGSGGGLAGSGSPMYFAASSDTGNIVANTLGTGSASQSFMIDVEHAPQSIADLRVAAEFLENRAEMALYLADVRAPGADGVSLHAAKQIGRWAVDSGVNNLRVFTNNLTLEAVYDRREGLPFFELTTVGGYPATVSRAVADLPICDIHVKPAELQSVTVSYRSDEFRDDPQQACVVGKQVAEAVLMNLPVKG